MAIKTTALVALLILPVAEAAHASGGVDCTTAGGDVIVSIGMSRSPIFEPLNAYVAYGAEKWTTNRGGEDMQLGSHQGMIETDRLAVDYMDDEGRSIVVSLRVSLRDETPDGYRGTATFADGKVHPVLCTFG